MAHAHCMLDTQRCRHTLRVCNTLIFHCNSGCTNMPQCYITLNCLYSCHYSIFYFGNINFSHPCDKNRFYSAVLDGGSQDSSVALVNRLSAGRTRDCLKADSHISMPCPYRAHAVPLPCRALIHTRHAAPLPCSESAMSFVKVRGGSRKHPNC